MIEFLKNRTKSLTFVFKGMIHLLKTENAIKAQFFVFLLMTFLGFYFKITQTEWLIQLLVFGLLFTAEALNTAIEKLCDFVHEEHHKKIEIIKDISAGAVGYAGFTGIIITIIIYAKYF